MDLSSGERATARYRELVLALGAERRYRHGWKSQVGRVLGVSPSYMQKILNSQMKTLGAETMDNATKALGLPLGFFFMEDVDVSRFRDYCGDVTPGVPEDDTGSGSRYMNALAEFHVALDGVLCVDDPAAAAAQVAFIRERVRRLDAAREAWRASTVR